MVFPSFSYKFIHFNYATVRRMDQKPTLVIWFNGHLPWNFCRFQQNDFEIFCSGQSQMRAFMFHMWQLLVVFPLRFEWMVTILLLKIKDFIWKITNAKIINEMKINIKCFNCLRVFFSSFHSEQCEKKQQLIESVIKKIAFILWTCNR